MKRIPKKLKRMPAALLLVPLCLMMACGPGGQDAAGQEAAAQEGAGASETMEPSAEKTEAPTKAPAKEPEKEVTQAPVKKMTGTRNRTPEPATEPEEEETTEEAAVEETAVAENLEEVLEAADAEGTADPAEQPAEGQSAEQEASEASADEPAEGDALPAEEPVALDPNWEFAGFSVINSGTATLYRASGERKGIVVGVNAGHGTSGGGSVYTQCHPDGTPKVTGGTTEAGATQAVAVSSGMTFADGTAERDVNLQVAQILKDLLLANGYDVLMLRTGEDVQLDNVARTVLCNNCADCHISIHYDGDGLDYDKGCFYMSVADGVKEMYPVSEIWTEHDRLGECLVAGLAAAGCQIFSGGSMQMDLTQTSYSKVPSVDVELGCEVTDHSEAANSQRAQGLLAGINAFFGY